MLQEYQVELNTIQLSLENFSTGIYFVKISTNSKTKTVKINKN